MITQNVIRPGPQETRFGRHRIADVRGNGRPGQVLQQLVYPADIGIGQVPGIVAYNGTIYGAGRKLDGSGNSGRLLRLRLVAGSVKAAVTEAGGAFGKTDVYINVGEEGYCTGAVCKYSLLVQVGGFRLVQEILFPTGKQD